MKEEIKKVLKPLAKAGVYSIEIWLLFFSPTFLLPERSWELVQLQAPFFPFLPGHKGSIWYSEAVHETAPWLQKISVVCRRM